MARGLSLHIGVNRVRPECYDGEWYGPLQGAENDAEAMAEVCSQRRFDPTRLLTAAATRAAVTTEIRAAAKILEPGDTYVLTYAGHGGSVGDVSGDDADGRDETWCLCDGHLFDDELYVLWCGFRRGVNILVVSDSCHSGTILWKSFVNLGPALWTRLFPSQGGSARGPVARNMPAEVQARMGDAMKAGRDAARQASTGLVPECSVVLLAACRDSELAYEDDGRGLFTTALGKALVNPPQKSGYRPLIDATRASLRRQNPEWRTLGAPAPAFLNGPVFTF